MKHEAKVSQHAHVKKQVHEKYFLDNLNWRKKETKNIL